MTLLIVYYFNGPRDQVCDELIRKIVGRSECAAGMLLRTMERDMVFTFKQPVAAKRALKRLKKKGIKAEISE